MEVQRKAQKRVFSAGRDVTGGGFLSTTRSVCADELKVVASDGEIPA
jgi:hypothetical protein